MTALINAFGRTKLSKKKTTKKQPTMHILMHIQREKGIVIPIQILQSLMNLPNLD